MKKIIRFSFSCILLTVFLSCSIFSSIHKYIWYEIKKSQISKVKLAENIASFITKNSNLKISIQHSDDQNARITSDKIVGEEILKHIITNFDLYKLYSDNKEFKVDFSAMMFGVVKELIQKGIDRNI